MKVAVLGPIVKDCVRVDGKLSVQIGGIPYYIATALKALGVDNVSPYITCGVADQEWATDNFFGLEIKFLSAEKTIEADLEYSSNNPDERRHFIKDYPNTINPSKELLNELAEYDYIIFGPLFHDNISSDLFNKLKHKNLILGNFGMFTYSENGHLIRKNPENLIKILPCLKYLFLDRSEAEFVSGQASPAASARYLQRGGVPNVIITEGSRGSHLFLGENYFKIPAFPPRRVADPTGAGDTYLAAFVRSLELFSDPQSQGKFAAMVATMSLEDKGAFQKSLTEVLARL